MLDLVGKLFLLSFEIEKIRNGKQNDKTQLRFTRNFWTVSMGELFFSVLTQVFPVKKQKSI